jgi:hypothetical protein
MLCSRWICGAFLAIGLPISNSMAACEALYQLHDGYSWGAAYPIQCWGSPITMPTRLAGFYTTDGSCAPPVGTCVPDDLPPDLNGGLGGSDDGPPSNCGGAGGGSGPGGGAGPGGGSGASGGFGPGGGLGGSSGSGADTFN